ncbi:MAG: glycoside hydrolase family 88 protein [Prochloraceae cyanobacterium]|nr:glycoside hydrolase family 88 protein [Prochloraceae cyanobacterium]
MQFKPVKFSRFWIANGFALLVALSPIQTKGIASLENISFNNIDENERIVANLNNRFELDSKQELEYLIKKYSSSLNNLNPNLGYPRSKSRDESLLLTPNNKWTSGFFPGILWQLYKYSQERKFLRQAEVWTQPIEPQKNNKKTHDLGFIVFNSFGRGYNYTGNKQYREVILAAANSLASRYDTKIGAIKSWDWNTNKSWCIHSPSWTYPVIIDNMMNLELLFWAAKNGGNPKYYNLAVTHAQKTLQNHIRADGSTYHVVDYDRLSGNVIKKVTWQGLSNNSVWARGQAWGLYGFTMTYRETEDREFLRAAERLADFFIDNLPEDRIPYWDFQAANRSDMEGKDSSAAAIAASGLLELSTLTDNPKKRQLYFQSAKQILKQLSSPTYLNRNTKKIPLIQHAIGNYPCKEEVDVSIIYGDYYYIEALLRYDSIVKKE